MSKPVNLPATKKHSVSVEHLPRNEPLVIYPHDGAVLVTLDARGPLRQKKTVSCSKLAHHPVVVLLAWGRQVSVAPGGARVFESRRRWWHLAGWFASRPFIHWRPIGGCDRIGALRS